MSYTFYKILYISRLSNGGDYLFQGKDDDEMTQWVNCINQQAARRAAGGEQKSQTLPAGSEGGRKDEPKRRSFFTLKKK